MKEALAEEEREEKRRKEEEAAAEKAEKSILTKEEFEIKTRVARTEHQRHTRKTKTRQKRIFALPRSHRS